MYSQKTLRRFKFLFHLRPKENIGTKKQFKGSDQI